MAKRRKKKKSQAPNIPQEVLDRARDLVAEEEDASALEETRKDQERRAARAERRARRRGSAAPLEAQGERAVKDPTVVAEMLHNPSIVVSEEELKSTYSYVISDLRSMGILAAVLLVVLVLLAQFI